MSKKNKKYTVRFDLKDQAGFYQEPMVMPAAALWNFDEAFMAYIAAGVDGLLNGHTDWDYEDPKQGIVGNKGTRKKLKRISKLAHAYVDRHTVMTEDEKVMRGAAEVLVLINEIGIGRLWD